MHRDKAYDYGQKMTKKLRELIPRQQFDVPIQAAISSKIISRETVKAYRKDVTAKLYGGDVTRKNKLLKKQKEGKKRMKSINEQNVDMVATASKLRKQYEQLYRQVRKIVYPKSAGSLRDDEK